MLTYAIFIAIGALLGAAATYYYLTREAKANAETNAAWQRSKQSPK